MFLPAGSTSQTAYIVDIGSQCVQRKRYADCQILPPQRRRPHVQRAVGATLSGRPPSESSSSQGATSPASSGNLRRTAPEYLDVRRASGRNPSLRATDADGRGGRGFRAPARWVQAAGFWGKVQGAAMAGRTVFRCFARRPMKFTSGRYEPEQNILHLWFPERVVLTDSKTVEAFFREVTHDWIDRCPQPPYLLVNYKNLHILPAATQGYAANISGFQSKIMATFRYAVSADLTGVAVSMGNLMLSRPAHVFSDEAEARAAIAAFKQRRAP